MDGLELIHLDTTFFNKPLRDGAQTEGVNFSIKIAKKPYQILVLLGKTVLTAFGMTKKSGRSAQNDPGLSAILNSNTPAVCLVGKSWDFHVEKALGITNEENLENIKESSKLFIKKKKNLCLMLNIFLMVIKIILNMH